MKKACVKCNIEKESKDFNKAKQNKDGLCSYCKPCLKEYKKGYRVKNLKIISDKNKIYRESIKDTLAISRKTYYKNNKELVLKQQAKRRKERMQEDPIFRIKINVGSSIRMALTQRGFSKKSRTFKLLGCSFEEFKFYIESKWESWMNWDNYGKYNGTLNFGWDFDHIIPLYLAKTEEELLNLNHYSNFQPLCSKVNRDIKKHKLF